METSDSISIPALVLAVLSFISVWHGMTHSKISFKSRLHGHGSMVPGDMLYLLP